MANSKKPPQSGGKKVQNGAVRSDAELDAIIAKNKKRATKGNIIMAVGIVALICVAFTMNVILIALAIIVIGIGFYFEHSAKEAIKGCMTDAALLPALNEVFDKVRYSAEDHIPEGVIRNTGMGFDFSIDKISGSDYVKAEYKGVSVEMSDITLFTVSTYTDDDGDETETEKRRFEGLWLICDFHKHFSADLLLRERDGVADKLLKKGIKTENDSFNKQFYIESESEHDVFYILTPHMMEYIQAMDKKAGGRTYMRFKKEGKLILALDTGRDFFEINNVRKASAESIREQFVSEVRYVTDLIDELKLVKTLYKENSGT